jgi:hypothetical protein
MSTVAQSPTQVNQQHSGLVGLGFGKYDAWLNGERIGTVYGNDYASAMTAYHRLINETRGSREWASLPTEHDQHVITATLAYGKIKAFAAMMAAASGDARTEWAERIMAEAQIFADTPRWYLEDYTGKEIAAEIAALLAPPAPTSPIRQAADDLLALVARQRIAASSRKMLASRLEKAVELAEAGETDFAEYGTERTDHGYYGNRHCNCPDATYRHLHVSPVGLCCKHTLAQYLAEQVQAEANRVADRVLIDQIERQGRYDLPTINPADAAEIARDIDRATASVDEPQRQPVARYRGETKSVAEQRREARAGLGGALKGDALNKTRSRWQI